jgi:predicted  nucleic acid-binding Zn-ribbon protein
MTDLLLAVVSLLLAISTFANNRRKDNRQDGERNGVISSELGNIKTMLEEVRNETREIKHSVSDHGERIAKCEAKITSALVRLERIERQFDENSKGA